MLNDLLLSPAGDLAARAAPASFAVEAVVAWRARAARSSQPLGASRCCWPPRVLRDRAAGYVRRLLAEEGEGEGASLRHAASLARQLRLLRELDCEALLRRLAASNLWAVAEQLATAACGVEEEGEEQREESRGAERETAEGDGGRLLQLLLSAAHQRQNARLVARLDPLMRRLGGSLDGGAAGPVPAARAAVLFTPPGVNCCFTPPSCEQVHADRAAMLARLASHGWRLRRRHAQFIMGSDHEQVSHGQAGLALTFSGADRALQAHLLQLLAE